MKMFMNIVAVMLAFSVFAELPQPYAYWKMDAVGEERTVADLSGNGMNLTIGEGVELVEDAEFGKVLYWQGKSSSFAKVANPAIKSRTISLWINCDAVDGDLNTDTNNKIPHLFNGWSGMYVNYTKNTSGLMVGLNGAVFYGMGNLTRTKWQHLIFTFEELGFYDEAQTNHVGTLCSYVNGALVKEVANLVTKSLVNVASTMVLGNNSTTYNGSDPRPYKGKIARVCLWNEALDADEVQEVFYRDREELQGSLIGYWRLDETVNSQNGKRYFSSNGKTLANLVCNENVQIVDDSIVGGKVAEFPNYASGSYANFALPRDSRGFSFGVWMNIPANIHEIISKPALDDSQKNNTMPNAYYFGNYSRLCFDDNCRNSDTINGHYFDAATIDNNLDQGFMCDIVTAQKGRWGHFGLTLETTLEEAGLYAVTPRIYVDGVCVKTGDVQKVANFSGLFQANSTFCLGSGSMSIARSFLGRMSDFAAYLRVLSDEEMIELSRGMPKVNAGGDFVLMQGVEGRLNGTISPFGKLQNRKAAATKLEWSIVSCPLGGESAQMKMKNSAVCTVVLPIVGEYVFRLTAKSESLGISEYDEVTVTCVEANDGNVAPSVTISGAASAKALVPVEFSAVAADPDSAPGTLGVRWKVVSGPGAASFNPVSGSATEAKFYAEGTYRIAAVASDGQNETASDHFEVKVEAGENIDLGSGLIAYWPFDITLREKTKGVAYTGINRSASSFEKGVDGYGIRLRNAFYPYVNTQMTLQETVADSESLMPVERYRAFSAWIYHDPADTNNSKCATIVSVPYTLGLWYNCENGVNGFSLYQQILKGPIGKGNIDEYAMPSVNPEGRWTHVYALFDRTTGYQTNTSELWIDGVKMTNRTKHGMGGGRVQATGYIMIGGHKNNGDGDNGHYKDVAGNYLSRTFPGVIDEVRMYNRRLTEAEIKYLAANPVVDVDHAPAATLESEKSASISRRDLALVAHVGDVGGDPSALSGRWEVIDGDAAAVSFGDASSSETTFTAKKAGVYSVVYVVSDGRHVTYSEPMEITVERAGMVLKIK